MKYLTSVLFILITNIFCTTRETADAYFSPSTTAGTGGNHRNNFYKDDINDNFAPTIVFSSSPSSSSKNRFSKKTRRPRENAQVDDIFREEYHDWAKKYGKGTGVKERFDNFKLNYMLQMQHNTRTGTFNLLNEFGDITGKEFDELHDKIDDALHSSDIDINKRHPEPNNVGVSVKAELVFDDDSVMAAAVVDKEVIKTTATADLTIPKVVSAAFMDKEPIVSPLENKNRYYRNLKKKKNERRQSQNQYQSEEQQTTTASSTAVENRVKTAKHRKVGPDNSPNDNNNHITNLNVINDDCSRVVGSGNNSGQQRHNVERNRRVVRWSVGPDQIL